MDPGTAIALVQIAFGAAEKAITVVGAALKFFKDSEALVVRLETERYRLSIWGTNCGINEGKLSPALLAAHEILLRQLKIIETEFGDADSFKERYELKGPASQDAMQESGDDGAVDRLVARMRKSLQESIIASAKPVESGIESSEQQEQSDEPGSKASNPGTWKRLRWGAIDKDRFAQRVTKLKGHIDSLNQLLSETSFQKSKEDNKRVNIIVVESAIDERSLNLVLQAARVVDHPYDDDVEISSMAKRKALADDEDDELEAIKPPVAVDVLTKNDFSVQDWLQGSRLLTLSKSTGKIVMLEKKAYDPELPDMQKQILRRRLQRLVLLMANRNAVSFRVPQALGYISDPDNNCWWLVFNYALESKYSAASIGLSPTTMPLTLADLLASSVKTKPSVDFRLALARVFCTTVSTLYSSGWLHKSLRSTSIIFPALASDVDKVLSQSSKDLIKFSSQIFLSGFEYSRPEEAVTSIDQKLSKSDLASAIYRHPNYQSEASSGYRIEYDIYSVGLVLSELALWMPLLAFLDLKTKDAGPEQAVTLSSRMTKYTRAEADVLRQRVTNTMKGLGPFRVGARFAQAAIWCLEAANTNLGSKSSVEHQPALDFYNNVVVPLGRLKM